MGVASTVSDGALMTGCAQTSKRDGTIDVVPRTSKPYRRFRARRGRDAGDLDDLRELNDPSHRPEPAAPAPRPGRRMTAPPARPGAPPDEPRPEPPKPRDRMRWVARIAVVAIVLIAAWAVVGFFTLRNAVGDSQALIHPATPSVLDEPAGGMLNTPMNVLVVGKDARKGETRSRADTILIMRTDPRSGRIKYLSIPRDTRVNHPIRGPEKINAAFRRGGQIGIIRAVKRHTGLSIHHIMVVNFRSFPRLVDELGGVTVNNPTELNNCPYPGGRTVSFPKGRVDLDGDRALEFARVRKCDSDFQRALRQQALIAAMKDKVLTIQGLPLAPWRGAAVTRAIATDMGTSDLVKFGWLQARLDQGPDDRILLSGSVQNIDGQSFVVPDPNANEAEVRRFVT